SSGNGNESPLPRGEGQGEGATSPSSATPSPRGLRSTLERLRRRGALTLSLSPRERGRMFVRHLLIAVAVLAAPLAALRLPRTVPGKLLQIARALQLEVGYSKRELLEAYLNLAPYGGNVEGVGAAARVYFHKDVSALLLPEAMALAVMPQSPSRRMPDGARET